MIELRVATWDQFKENTITNFQEWGNKLTLEQYWERERVSKDYVKGHRGWILVNSEAPEIVLASCETYSNESVYCHKGTSEIKTGISESVASVFVEPIHRGKGYASKMMKLLYEKFEIQENRIFCDLYSDIDPKVYEKCGWNKYPATTFKLELPLQQESSTPTGKFESSPITDENIEIVLKRDNQIIKEQVIEISNLKSTIENESIENVFSKLFTPSEFYWEISQAKVYSTYISNLTMPIEFGHVIYKQQATAATTPDIKNNLDIKQVSSYIVWTFDFRESQLKILKLVAESESEFQYLIEKAVQQCKVYNFNTIYGWWPSSSNSKFTESFIHSINQKVTIRDGSVPMVTSWIKPINENIKYQKDNGIWLSVEKFGWV